MDSMYSLIFVASFMFGIQAAAQNNQVNPDYSGLVDACLTDWKACLGTTATDLNRASCRACLRSCGEQDISTPPNGILCTQLRDHCQVYLFSPPPGAICRSPTCVSTYSRCRRDGRNSVACKQCGSACLTCPRLYTACVGRRPPPVAPGTCPSEGCTYYNKQCANSRGLGTRFCGDCEAACIGIENCEGQFESCDRLNV